MKKSIVWVTRLGLIGSLTLVTWLSSSVKTLALPKEQVVKTLQSIPVFAVTDDQGGLIVSEVTDKDKKQLITYVFISQSDASKFFEDLKKNKPDLIKQKQVNPLPLAMIYTAQQEQAKPNELAFLYVPDQKQVDEAKKILAKNGQEYKGGVPLFVARSGKEQGYLTMQQNNQTIVPMFFNLAQLTEIIDRLKKEKPELAADLKIEVIPLETFMATIKESNEPNLSKFILIPSEESLKAVESAQQKATPPSNSSSPTTKPKK